MLEWANQGCPYEQKHYMSGNMESLQKQWTAKGVVWLSILVGPAGRAGIRDAGGGERLSEDDEGFADGGAAGSEGDDWASVRRAHDAAYVCDRSGGKIVYQGAIDNKPTPDPASLKGADNYVSDALNAAMAGKPVAVAVTKPYGCAVKYGN